MNDARTKSAETAAIDLGAFVRGSAHEFANPLNAIVMYAELARTLFQRQEAQRATEALERLIANCGTCATLLQSFRRFGAGLNALPPERVPLRNLVDSAVTLVVAERSPFPAVAVEGGDLWIEADRRALERALAELLFNAAEAQAASIRIAMRREDASVFLDVIDDGTGIPPDMRDKVIQPFFSTRRHEGKAGLGLNLVQEVLRTNGGALHVDAPVQNARGACMRMRLSPCAEAA
ncbi:MAG TPA: HAMP domain-containing sensor histidine kinase [Rudaea sp.]